MASVIMYSPNIKIKYNNYSPKENFNHSKTSKQGVHLTDSAYIILLIQKLKLL